MLFCLLLCQLLGQAGLFDFVRVFSPSIPGTRNRNALCVVNNKHQHATAGIKLLARLTPRVKTLSLLHVGHAGDKVGHHSLAEAFHLSDDLLFSALIIFDLFLYTVNLR